MKIYLSTASKIPKRRGLKILMSYFAIITPEHKWGTKSTYKYYTNDTK